MTKTAFITGASRGIGAEAAVALARHGYRVAVTARTLAEGEKHDHLGSDAPLPGSLQATAEAVRAVGGEALCLQADILDEQSVIDAANTALAEFGRIDLLFNNAGTGAPAVPIDELDVDTWRRVVDTNLTGAFLCARAAIALMKRQDPPGGRIINNGSISAHTPRPLSAPYTATKHAITGLTKSIALDGRPFGITCGQIDIGNAATELTERMTSGVLQADGSLQPEPRMLTDDVARGLAYMASLPPDANVLTMTVMAAGMPYVGRG